MESVPKGPPAFHRLGLEKVGHGLWTNWAGALRMHVLPDWTNLIAFWPGVMEIPGVEKGAMTRRRGDFGFAFGRRVGFEVSSSMQIDLI